MVVLLHGWASSAELMRPIARGLADQWRVINIDMPGHGRSPKPATGIGVPEFADVVTRAIQNLDVQACTLVGHSNGGRVSMYLASGDPLPFRIERLVLVSPSGIEPKRSMGYHVRKTTATVLKAPFNLLPGKLGTAGHDWLRHTLTWSLLGSSDYRTLGGVMREVFVKTVNFYVKDRLPSISVPTLLFRGTEDTAISDYQIRTIERLIPDAAVIELEGAGHYGYLDQSEAFLSATRAFLSAPNSGSA